MFDGTDGQRRWDMVNLATTNSGSHHRRLQAQAYPGIAWVILNRVLISRGPDAKTHGHQHIVYACTDVCIAYSVVTKYAFRNCASNAA